MSVNQLLYANNYNLNGSFVGAITEVSAGSGISVSTTGSIATVNQKTVSGLVPGSFTWPSTVDVDATGTIIGISESYTPANITDHFVMVGTPPLLYSGSYALMGSGSGSTLITLTPDLSLQTETISVGP